MRKYIASKRQREIHLKVLMPCALMSGAAILCTLLGMVGRDMFVCLLPGVLCFGIVSVAYAWRFIDDPILREFSFDSYSVVFYKPFHRLVFNYAECVEIGFTRWVGSDAAYNQQYLYYIYLSKVALNDSQRNRLFFDRSKLGWDNTPRYQSEFVLFQYTPEIFAEFIECVPEPFRSNLIEEESCMSLTPREQRLNS